MRSDSVIRGMWRQLCARCVGFGQAARGSAHKSLDLKLCPCSAKKWREEGHEAGSSQAGGAKGPLQLWRCSWLSMQSQSCNDTLTLYCEISKAEA